MLTFNDVEHMRKLIQKIQDCETEFRELLNDKDCAGHRASYDAYIKGAIEQATVPFPNIHNTNMTSIVDDIEQDVQFQDEVASYVD